MRGRRSTGEGGEREPCPRRARSLGEDVPLRPLERLERREPSPREEADGAADSAADQRLERAAGREQRAGAVRLEPQQPGQLRARTVEERHAEVATVVGREVDAAELEI